MRRRALLAAFAEGHRPQATNNLFVAWETLTHASNPA
jgi:hypothetical protein